MASPFPAAGPGYPLQVLAASCFGGSGLSASIPLAAAVVGWALETEQWDSKDGKGLQGTGNLANAQLGGLLPEVMRKRCLELPADAHGFGT